MRLDIRLLGACETAAIHAIVDGWIDESVELLGSLPRQVIEQFAIGMPAEVIKGGIKHLEEVETLVADNGSLLFAPQHGRCVLARQVVCFLVQFTNRLTAVDSVRDACVVAFKRAMAELVGDRWITRRSKMPSGVLIVRVFRARASPSRVHNGHADHILEALVLERCENSIGPRAAKRHVQVISAGFGFKARARCNFVVETGCSTLKVPIGIDFIESCAHLDLGHYLASSDLTSKE
mmetsp:Transcript_1595/g.4508  ORF Transcript_1595/g.4508 Transcript_1595/m.4508 type:complete len:236 (+) Transcript_1595:658-1365(+)